MFPIPYFSPSSNFDDIIVSQLSLIRALHSPILHAKCSGKVKVFEKDSFAMKIYKAKYTQQCQAHQFAKGNLEKYSANFEAI